MPIIKRNNIHADQMCEPSFIRILDEVLLQVEYHCFADLRFKRIDPFYSELCFIIAEVLALSGDSVVKINGCEISAKVVCDVFSQIRNHHVQMVFDNFQNITHKVFNKKSYLRTALYNAFFEYESHHINKMMQPDY